MLSRLLGKLFRRQTIVAGTCLACGAFDVWLDTHLCAPPPKTTRGRNKMCKIVNVGVGEHPDHINIEFERDPSLRAREVVIVNHNAKTGKERQVVKLICYDNGEITAGKAVDLVDGVDVLI